jgi:hypothetical protein
MRASLTWRRAICKAFAAGPGPAGGEVGSARGESHEPLAE